VKEKNFDKWLTTLYRFDSFVSAGVVTRFFDELALVVLLIVSREVVSIRTPLNLPSCTNPLRSALGVKFWRRCDGAHFPAATV
jgi:hypothetical protein